MNIQHLVVHLQSGNETFEVCGDNAQVLVSDSDPQRTDLIKSAICRVESQDRIEVMHPNRPGKFTWQGAYDKLITKENVPARK